MGPDPWVLDVFLLGIAAAIVILAVGCVIDLFLPRR